VAFLLFWLRRYPELSKNSNQLTQKEDEIFAKLAETKIYWQPGLNR